MRESILTPFICNIPRKIPYYDFDYAHLVIEVAVGVDASPVPVGQPIV